MQTSAVAHTCPKKYFCYFDEVKQDHKLQRRRLRSTMTQVSRTLKGDNTKSLQVEEEDLEVLE